MNFARLDLTLNPQEEVRCRLRFRHIIKELSGNQHFTREETESLLMVHYKLTRDRPIDRKYFRRILYKLLQFQNDILIDYIFSAFDLNNNLTISPKSWVLGMSVFLRGTLDERLQFCFKVYDFMNTGFVGREQMFQLLKNNFRHGSHGEDSEEIVRDLIDIILKKMDWDRDGKISFDDYRFSVWANNELIEFLGQCLPSRPMAYNFMSTFTTHVSTMHATMFRKPAPTRAPPPAVKKPSQKWSSMFGAIM